jgi:chitin disaccharide deacetylase
VHTTGGEPEAKRDVVEQARKTSLVLNADDFGLSADVNKAVVQGHCEGVLTSASLMVTGEAFEDAVRLARATPTLAVGLHLVLVDGRAALPQAEIPHLVDGSGRFPDSALRAGLWYGFSRAARAELAREVEAQFERFAATGLPLSHVDGHQHLHVHPVVFDLLLPLAERYGARGVRLPRDDLWLALHHDCRRVAVKVAWAVALGLVCRRCAARLRGRRLGAAQRVYGVMQSGHMGEAYVVDVLRRLQGPLAELYFHPALVGHDDDLGPNRGDWVTLLSPAVRGAIAERGLRLTSYSALKEGG